MKKLAVLLILFGFIFIISCSAAPQIVGHKYSSQKKIEAAHHWNILAKDFTKQLSLYLQNNPINEIGFGYSFEESSVSEKPFIYIQPNDRSVFGKAFRQCLVYELTKLGYPITYRPYEAITLRWSIQKIHYNATRRINALPGTYTALSAIGYGVYKLWEDASTFGATIGTAAITDVLYQTKDYIFEKQAPNCEINLAITISKNGIMLARQSGIYYVNSEDTWQYNNIPDFEGQTEAALPGKKFILVNQ